MVLIPTTAPRTRRPKPTPMREARGYARRNRPRTNALVSVTMPLATLIAAATPTMISIQSIRVVAGGDEEMFIDLAAPMSVNTSTTTSAAARHT